MTSRFRSILLPIGLLAATCCGCDDAQFAGPIPYRPSEKVGKDLANKPKLQAAVQKSLVALYGPDVRHMKVPENSGLRDGGIYLADHYQVGGKVEPTLERDPVTGKDAPVEGGYSLYRKHCLHCHGVFGAGDGPTSSTLVPRPRDYRPGIFKFTSTNPTNAKPSRADLRKTLLYGLHGTSMPGFEATMSPSEIDQVIDYMTFLSMRGETERLLIDEAMNGSEDDADAAVAEDAVKGIVQNVATSWRDAETQVVNPSTRRVEPDRASILRGRDYYLGAAINDSGAKLECIGCHGAGGRGNGPSFIETKIYQDVVFRQYSFDEAIARFYRLERDKAGTHAPAEHPAKSDPAAVAKFFEENPALLTVLRKDHGLLPDLAEPAFAEKLKAEPQAVALAAIKLLPELDDADYRALLLAKYDLWVRGSLDAWDNPLRPANLIDGVYKGGRRPIDLYWRIAKGINGAKMPAHSNTLTDDQIWDVVNFVLALPDEPGLLPEALPTPTRPVVEPSKPKPASVARSR